ncbi:cytochrome c oxidase assembly factor Coa1 family protein [Stenotrophomonas sp. GZD-301]|uniref:cytochrome c oxidase assembly factor Coa1 family protein n=1 Tax=Stenotrophomonas sp. GZD-301 TaxID=3404814 RepID=UPI003BB6D498
MTPSPPIPPATARRGWWARHWRWAMPALVLLVLLGGVLAAGFAVDRWSQWSRGSEPYVEAMRRARCSIELAQVLGEPIDDGYLPVGTLQQGSDGSGRADLVLKVRGPQAHGDLFLAGRRQQAEWDYPVMYVLTGDTHTIDLTALDDAEAVTRCELADCRAQGECPPAPALPPSVPVQALEA